MSKKDNQKDNLWNFLKISGAKENTLEREKQALMEETKKQYDFIFEDKEIPIEEVEDIFKIIVNSNERILELQRRINVLHSINESITKEFLLSRGLIRCK